MNRDVAIKWAKALESGEYEQGRGRLRSDSEDHKAIYCCWGVLTELAVEEGIQPEGVKNSCFIAYPDVSSGVLDACEPPSAVVTWVNATNDEVDEFVAMNDAKKFSFLRIAQEIRKRVQDEV